MNYLFSVIIPALNEEKLLPRLFLELKNQTEKNFEVILVDANSTDRTVELARSFKSSFALTILHNNKKNISSSRNLGAAKARGKYLLFIDADNYINPTFLEHMGIKVKKNKYDMIIPAVKPDSKKIIYKIAYKSVNFLVHIATVLKMPFSTGGNFIIKKESFGSLKGFDESIFVGEDHDMVAKAHKKGLKVGFIHSPKVVFSVRRFEKEGMAVLLKYFISTVYIALFGKITKKIYNYQMGGDYYKKAS